MPIDQSKIAFLTTVANFKLYRKTSIYYPKNTRRYVIDGRKGMYGLNSIIYMMEKLKGQDIDWLIMIDEDGIIIDNDAILDLINYMHEKQYLVCGMQDGGVNPIRHHSPFAINTYFSIINFKELQQIWDAEQVVKNQYIKKDEFELFDRFIKHKYELDSLFEGYYCFYYWILRQGLKILYLDAENPIEGDQATNIVFNQLNKPIIYHTWYARLYGESSTHTQRINNVLDIRNKINNKKTKYINPVIFVDKSFKGNAPRVGLYKKYKKKLKKIIKSILFDA